MGFFTAMAITALAATAGWGVSTQTSAQKSAKGAAEQQNRLVGAAQDALVAKEAKAASDLAAAEATSQAQAKAVVSAKRKAVARSETIYTSPLGIGGTAEVSRKVLLGQ